MTNTSTPNYGRHSHWCHARVPGHYWTCDKVASSEGFCAMITNKLCEDCIKKDGYIFREGYLQKTIPEKPKEENLT